MLKFFKDVEILKNIEIFEKYWNFWKILKVLKNVEILEKYWNIKFFEKIWNMKIMPSCNDCKIHSDIIK